MNDTRKIFDVEILPFEEVIELGQKELIRYMKSVNCQLNDYYPAEEVSKISDKLLDFIYDENPDEQLMSLFDESKRQRTWLANHYAIMNCITEALTNGHSMPSVTTIAREQRLSRTTVTKHLRYFEKGEHLQQHYQKWKIASERLLMSLYNAAFRADDTKTRLKAMDLFFKQVERIYNPVREKQTENTYIQINNIYINQESIRALPDEKRKAIEGLLLEANTNLS